MHWTDDEYEAATPRELAVIRWLLTAERLAALRLRAAEAGAEIAVTQIDLALFPPNLEGLS